MSLTRRQLLVSTAAVATVAVTPPVVLEAVAAEPKLPMWMVGTPDAWDWQPIRAASARDALMIFAEDNSRTAGDDMCEAQLLCEALSCPTSGPCWRCGCEDVNAPSGSLEVQRVEIWDDIDDPTPADWIRAGMGAFCSRCGEECCGGQDAHVVEEKPVCECCMEIEDWDQIDPEYAAVLRSEEELEKVGRA